MSTSTANNDRANNTTTSMDATSGNTINNAATSSDITSNKTDTPKNIDKKERNSSRFAYSLGAFGHDFFYFALSTYLINFITSHLFDTGDPQLNTTLVTLTTTIIMVVRIAELFIDPLIGNAIDRTKTRWGHFRPWVVIGGTVSSVILCILFSNMGGLVKINPYLYIFIFTLLYITMDIFYSFKDIGFWSMLPALSLDTREREKTATFARIGSSVGQSLVGVAVMPIVLFFSLNSNGGTGDGTGWFWFGFIAAAVAFVTALGVGVFTREKEDKLRENKKDTTGFKQIMKTLVSNDQLLWTAISYFFYASAICVVNALELYYFQYIIGDSYGFSILQSINTVIGIVSVGSFPVLVHKLRRHFLFTGCVITLLIGLVLFYCAGTNMLMAIVAAELFFIPQPLVFLVVLMTITDSVEYGQLKHGHRDESLVLSVRPLIDKLGGAISNGVVAQTAILAGMTTGATASSITSEGELWFKIMMFVLPALFILIAIVLYHKKVTLTEDKHAEIVSELKRTWGSDYTK